MEVKEQTRPDEPVAFSREEEMPLAAVSVATSLANKTGSWRYLRPIYDPKKPPCNHACPAGNDIQGFISLILKERFREAWELLRQTNPFPAITGRVCHHPCELECNRREFDEPLSIRLLERLSADEGFKEGFRKPVIEPRPERVAIVGSGPAGLSCAHFLALRGYRVTVFEAEREPGGMLRLGIPEYRLPREVLDREVSLVEQLGVEIKTGVRVGQDVQLEELGDYAAVFLATGLSQSRELKIPGIEAEGVLHGLDLLKRVNLGEGVELGGRVAIVG
ncbi:MAG: FAD-dependent oxidoreductase, partial [Candidatus Bipolaricaulia bacterium]